MITSTLRILRMSTLDNNNNLVGINDRRSKKGKPKGIGKKNNLSEGRQSKRTS